MPAGPERLLGVGQHLPGFGQVEHDAVEVDLVDPLVDVALLHPVGGIGAEQAATLARAPVGEVGPQLVADHLGPGPKQRHGQRPRAHPGLEDPHAGADVGGEQDGPEVLRVDDLGPAGHLEHDVGQGRPHDEEAPSRGGRPPRPPRPPMMSSWATIPAWVWNMAPACRVRR